MPERLEVAAGEPPGPPPRRGTDRHAPDQRGAGGSSTRTGPYHGGPLIRTVSLRLAVIAHHINPLRPPFAGGLEALTWALARWLAEQGHDVTVFAPPGSVVPGVTLRPLRLGHATSWRGRADVSMPPEGFLAAHHAYQSLMLELAADEDEFDLVHSHALHHLPVAMAGLLPMPLLLTLHTPPTPWLESALAMPGVRRTVRLSAVSRATAVMWEPVAAVDDVVPNGVDMGVWPAGPGGHAAVWCGRIVPEKAPHLAIAAAKAAGMALRLAGPIVDRDYFERAVRPHLGAGVVHVGHLAPPALADLVGRSRVAVVSPVWDEPFGLVAAEAMATGTPVAAFARGGLADVVGRAGGRLCRPDDVDALAAAMLEASALDRSAVRWHARARHGLDAMGHGYERLYRRIRYEADPLPAVPA